MLRPGCGGEQGEPDPLPRATNFVHHTDWVRGKEGDRENDCAPTSHST